MTPTNLEIYCGLLEEAVEPWVRERAAKQLEDAINPDNQRKQLVDVAAKAWRQYTDLFDAGMFREGANFYAEYLAIKARLALHNTSIKNHHAKAAAETEPQPSTGEGPDCTANKALNVIREATEGALDDADLLQAVVILISQRDNARHYAETFRQKLAELGYKYV